MRGRGMAGLVVLALLAASASFAGPAAASPGLKPTSRPTRERPPAKTPESTTTTLPTAPPANVEVPEATSYVLVDVNTGNVLAGYNERLRVPPASLTKVLTALIAVSYLPSNAKVLGTKVSWNAYPNTVGIEIGVAWPLNEVLQSLLVLSANDAAYAIAQRLSGSLAAFGGVMERSAQQLGMQDSPVFHDPAGLDGTEGYGGGNLVSARDLAIAGRDLLRVPELASIVTEQQYHFVDPTGVAHWLPSMDETFLESYTGAIGIKTGYTDRAGRLPHGRRHARWAHDARRRDERLQPDCNCDRFAQRGFCHASQERAGRRPLAAAGSAEPAEESHAAGTCNYGGCTARRRPARSLGRRARQCDQPAELRAHGAPAGVDRCCYHGGSGQTAAGVGRRCKHLAGQGPPCSHRYKCRLGVA